MNHAVCVRHAVSVYHAVCVRHAVCVCHAVCVYHTGAERSEAVVSSAAEEALKAAVYNGAASSSHQGGPAHVLLAYLEQPFTDLRIAAYRSCRCMHPCQCCEPISVLCVSLRCMLMLKASLCRLKQHHVRFESGHMAPVKTRGGCQSQAKDHISCTYVLSLLQACNCSGFKGVGCRGDVSAFRLASSPVQPQV